MKAQPNIIVGGGIVGLLTAWYLIEAGETVVLVERHRVGRESSWAGGGILSPLYPDRYPAIAALVRWSRDVYPRIVVDLTAITNIDSQLVSTELLVFEEQRRAASLEDSVAVTELASLEPALRPPTPYATRYGACHVRNPRLLSALHTALIEKGVSFIEACDITDFVIKDGRFLGVVTRHDGVIGGSRCVVTAGAWTGELLRKLDLKVPIWPVRGQMIVFLAPPGLISRVVVHDYKYLIPRLDGRVLVGSTVELAGFDKSITLAAREELRRAAYDLVPALKKFPIEHHWAGLRPGSPDDAPFIDELPGTKDIFVCSGHYRNGFAIGPATARLVVDLMLEREPIVDPHPYRLNRLCS